jgi:hypothetical protein
MTRYKLNPTTMEGIKRYAKRLKKDLRIPHSRALDEAAIAAGYENFKHAQNTLTIQGGADVGNNQKAR